MKNIFGINTAPTVFYGRSKYNIISAVFQYKQEYRHQRTVRVR